MLQGRAAERAAIGRLLDDAKASRGGALVLRGLAGVGKSVLLEDAATRAEGLAVLRTRGVESEAELAFAALHRLLHPVLGYADQLPEPQTHALRAAFGQAAAPAGGDRFLVFLATLTLLSEAAANRPLLAVVDDAHWLDDASAAALQFVARRLQAERVALLFGAREGDVRQFDARDLATVEVGSIGRSAGTALLTEAAGGEVSEAVVSRLLTATDGNPLALTELAEALTPAQLAGRDPLPSRLPLTSGVERGFADRARRLPADAQTLLLIAATEDSGRLVTIGRAAAVLGVGSEAMDLVEATGMLQVEDGLVTLRHPLVRSAVYGGATSGQRRRVHRALAEALGESGDADRTAWHLAAAADEPDETVVAALDQVAERARQRGGHEASAAAWERAAELTRDPEARAHRYFSAARGAWFSGQTQRASALTDAANRSASSAALRADIARLRARVEWNTGSLQLGHQMLVEGARDVAPHDPARAREMAMFAAALASFGGDSGVGIRPTELVPRPDETASAGEHCFAHLLEGFDHVARGDMASAAPMLRAAYDDGAPLEGTEQDLLPNLGIAALHLGDDAAALHYDNVLLTRGRSTGALMMILYALTRRGFVDIATGKWENARTDATEALSLAGDAGQPGLSALPLAWLTLGAALRGSDDYAAHLAAAEKVVATHPLGILDEAARDMLRWAKAIMSFAQPAVAHHHLTQLGLPLAQRIAAIDRVETAVRADRRAQAEGWVRDLQVFADATGAGWAAAAAAHGRAVLAPPEVAEAEFRTALEHHAGSLRVFDRARTELAYGEFLRRTRRRVDARAQLRAALETFTDLGAREWQQRAAGELRASGETARRREPSPAGKLTPQERQVAALVQEGLSNREVAAQLFLSPRTIDFHLRNVFSKLGVSSRTELARHALT